QNRIVSRRKLHSLMHRIQKTVGPQFGIDSLTVAIPLGNQHAEGGKIFIFAPQTITQPGSHTRSVALLGARLEKCDGRVVIDRFGMQTADDAELVHDLGCVRKKIAHPGSGIAVLVKIVVRSDEWKFSLIRGHTGKPLTVPDRKSTRLNSSHVKISYAVFCLK